MLGVCIIVLMGLQCTVSLRAIRAMAVQIVCPPAHFRFLGFPNILVECFLPEMFRQCWGIIVVLDECWLAVCRKWAPNQAGF